MRRTCFLLIVFALCTASLRAQSSESPPITKVFAILTTAIDSKTSSKGDEIALRTLNDISVDGRVVIPKGAKLTGRLLNVINKSKEEPKTFFTITIDKAILKDGEVLLQAIIVAIAAPPAALPEDPTYAMLHSNEPKMVGSRNSSVGSSGTLPPSSKASSNAAVAAAELKGAHEPTLLLTEDSQGAIGYEDVQMYWDLSVPPPLTVLETKAKNLKFAAGTQMLLRMARPRLPY